jgi:hypothetical protein
VAKQEAFNGTKAHQRYKLADGTIVPGCTTITGILNKPALVRWANNLGLQGIDSSKYTDAAAVIGTLAHELIQEYLGGPKVDLSEFSKEQIDKAQNSLISFFEWEKTHRIKMIFCERQLVSETFRFGGSMDFYGTVDGKLELIDFKTCKALYPEHRLQVGGGYTLLAKDNGIKVDRTRIIRVGRDETEGFDEAILTADEIKRNQACFKALLKAYPLIKELRIL